MHWPASTLNHATQAFDFTRRCQLSRVQGVHLFALSCHTTRSLKEESSQLLFKKPPSSSGSSATTGQQRSEKRRSSTRTPSAQPPYEEHGQFTTKMQERRANNSSKTKERLGSGAQHEAQVASSIDQDTSTTPNASVSTNTLVDESFVDSHWVNDHDGVRALAYKNDIFTTFPAL